MFFMGNAKRRRETVASDVAREVALIELIYRSALEREGAAEVVVLTDETTDLGALTSSLQIVRYDLRDIPLMLARLTAESRYVSEHPLDRPIVLADTDILINRSIASLFADDFDVAVTVRRKRTMPINSGVRLIHNRRPEVSRRFMRELAELVGGRFLHEANWWADQMALNAMVSIDARLRLPASVTHNGFIVRALPVGEYNYSPPAHRWAMMLPYRRKAILHFKSARRKALMPDFFRRHFAAD
ncbi:MAG: hypothetical protein WDM94_12925 [Bauldia sp.]